VLAAMCVLKVVHSGPMSNDVNNTASEGAGPAVTDPVALELIARATRARIFSRVGTGLLVASVVIGFIAARTTDGSPSSTLVGVIGAFLPFWIAAFVNATGRRDTSALRRGIDPAAAS
jgi:uncharacterized membrane protein YeaQ/YmgE (transglycosylase-associated protein family)